MKSTTRFALLFLFALTLGVGQFWASPVQAQSSFFTSRGCVNCHAAPTAATCNGCHHHGNSNLKAVTNKTSYTPGETVSATLSGGSKTGWIRAILYDQNNVQIAISNGTASGMGSSTTFPATLTAPAPSTPGTYTWKMAYYGNQDGSGTGDVHGEKVVNLAAFTVTGASAVTAPTLTLSMLADGSYTNIATLNVSGTASDPEGIQSVTVNGVPATVNPAGTFSAVLTLVAGSNPVTVVATDSVNTQTTASRTINYDPAAPVLTVADPADNSTTTQSFVTVTGTISETSTVTVTDNAGTPQSAAINGSSFTATVNLVSGLNTIDITATDLAGNSANAKRSVTFTPAVVSLAVTQPSQDITTNQATYAIQGTVSGAQTPVTVTITADGQTYTPPVTNGSFTQAIAFTTPKTYAVAVTAADQAGNQSTVQRNIIYTQATGGDLNGDSAVTIADALMSLKVAVGVVPMDPAYLAQGDIAPYVGGASQPDGKIDLSDALLVMKICVGMPL